MIGHECVRTCLLALALWVVLSGLDDLFLQLVFCRLRFGRAGRFRWPNPAELESARPKRIAIFVPLWHEHGVIEKMLEHNLAANRYKLRHLASQGHRGARLARSTPVGLGEPGSVGGLGHRHPTPARSVHFRHVVGG
ncbi:MAG: hypothetical protein M1436_02560, partial [Acidobacteria bacterium]|nr:hypothetical protein [Acidobacteriota bacterium]